MLELRRLSDPEWELVKYLSGNDFSSHREDWPAATALNDGGMGSLRFEGKEGRKFGRVVSACSFQDADGVQVLAELYAGDDGQPLELNIWKVDFAPLVQIPEPESFERQALGREPD